MLNYKMQGTQSPKTALDVAAMSKENPTCHPGKKTSSVLGNIVEECRTLTRMELRRRYCAEANAHRNMLSRAKSGKAKVHPKFRDFVKFLQHVGPMPGKGMTLDRIDNDDPLYAPGKVRWADRRTQNSNKSDTLTFYCSQTATTYTASILAKRQKVSASTIRKRYERGWSDEEIIAGKRGDTILEKPKTSGSVPARYTKFPPGLYSPTQLAMLVRSEGYLTHAGDIAFHRDAQSAQHSREVDGEEYIIATYEEMLAIEEGVTLEACPPPTTETIRSKFVRLLTDCLPHIYYPNLTPYEEAKLQMYVPEWIEAQKAKYEAIERFEQSFSEKL